MELAVFGERELEGAWALIHKQYDAASTGVGGGMIELVEPVMLLASKLDLVLAMANIRQRWETLTPEDKSDHGADQDASASLLPFAVMLCSESH